MKAKEIFETTTSGSIAAVSQPMTGGTLKRTTVGQGVYGKNKKAGNLLTGKKSKGKFVNSIGESATNSKEVVEADLHEESLKDIDAQISFHQEALGRGGKSSDSHHRKVLKKLFKKRKEVNKDKLDEDDLILVPGQGHRLKTGFIPHSSDRRDHEVEMAKSDLFQAAKHAKTIYELIKDVSEDDGLPGWVQEKIIKANDYLTAVSEYLEHKGSVAEGSEKPDMREQILAGIRQGKKQNNATKIFYYSWLLIKGMLASASYEKFINSWAGEKWFEKHKGEIEKFAREEKARSQKDYKIEAPKALAEMTGGVVAGGGVGEDIASTVKQGVKSLKRGIKGWDKNLGHDPQTIKQDLAKASPEFVKDLAAQTGLGKGSPAEFQKKLAQRKIKQGK